MKWDLLGNEWAVDLLKEHISERKQRHAYLFTGPPGIGRRTLALRFAQAINCPQPPELGMYCGVCRTCKSIERMSHPDLSFIQADETGGILKVEEIRELQRSLSLTPYDAHFRVAIFLRFEEANLSTANALLKTLEEPSPRVVLILTAETTEMLLPTIVSRCEVLRLRPLSFTSLEKSLQDKWNFDSEKAFFLSRISNGCPGLARRFSEMPELLERRAAWMKDFYEIILDTNRIQRFTYADRITKDKDKEKMRTILHTWISFWRDVILLVNGCSSQLANPDFFEQISNISSHLEPERARQVLVNLLRTLDLLQHNINYKLAFEVLMLDLPILSKSPIIGK